MKTEKKTAEHYEQEYYEYVSTRIMEITDQLNHLRGIINWKHITIDKLKNRSLSLEQDILDNWESMLNNTVEEEPYELPF